MDRLNRLDPTTWFKPLQPLRELRPSPVAQPGAPGDRLSLSPAAQSAPAPSTTIVPDGHLDYYRKRHADFVARHPDVPAPSYYLGYGDKYVRRFTEELGPKLSPQGQLWLARARQNLQLAIDAEIRRDPAAFDRLEQNDQAFMDFAYATHSKAYLDAGLGALPMKDLVLIGLTPDTADLMTRAGLQQVGEVAAGIARERARQYLDRGLRMRLDLG